MVAPSEVFFIVIKNFFNSWFVSCTGALGRSFAARCFYNFSSLKRPQLYHCALSLYRDTNSIYLDDFFFFYGNAKTPYTFLIWAGKDESLATYCTEEAVCIRQKSIHNFPELGILHLHTFLVCKCLHFLGAQVGALPSNFGCESS